MEVQIEVGKGIQCDGIEIMFGDSISSVVKAAVEQSGCSETKHFYILQDSVVRLFFSNQKVRFFVYFL